MMSYPIVTICCSTRYRDEIIKLYNELTKRGYVVLADLTDHNDQLNFDKVMVDQMHLHKIDIADKVFFLLKDNHMGESVSKEFEYAKNKSKSIYIVELKEVQTLEESC